MNDNHIYMYSSWTARGWKTKTWRDKGVVDTRKESAETPVFRTSMELTQREQQTEGATQPGTAVYLIVGYAKWDFRDAKYKKNRAGTKDPTGTIKPSDKEILPWTDEKHPTCYVVSEFFEKEPDQLHLLVLLHPENGLYTPYQIGKGDVFFRYEYRTAATSLKARRATWNQAITEKQTKFQRAHDSGKVILEPHESFGKEITMLVAAFEHTKSDWILQELEHLLKRAHMDLEYRPAPEYEGLVSFAEAELAEFTGEHAEMVVQEAAQLRPSVQNLTPSRGIDVGTSSFRERERDPVLPVESALELGNKSEFQHAEVLITNDEKRERSKRLPNKPEGQCFRSNGHIKWDLGKKAFLQKDHGDLVKRLADAWPILAERYPGDKEWRQTGKGFCEALGVDFRIMDDYAEHAADDPTTAEIMATSSVPRTLSLNVSQNTFLFMSQELQAAGFRLHQESIIALTALEVGQRQALQNYYSVRHTAH
ncbi:hypothetical protein PV11_06812 [Exophiala sideris]|uniref:Uncharacterized protein n=1 Tax=Exophiala sideris TaxID=1016849 RepID=A0A0D1YWP3_9EURO|nr:hypothetical protein PV11_06812 [Exophiala sideris]